MTTPLRTKDALALSAELVAGACLATRIEALAIAHEGYSARLRERIRVAGGLTIYGAGTLGRQVLAASRRGGLPVRRFLDRRCGPGADMVVDGVPVCTPAQSAPSDVIVVAVGRDVMAIRGELGAAGIETIGLTRLFHLLGGAMYAEANYLADLAAYADRYAWLHRRLADSDSRRTLVAVIAHRMALDEEPLFPVTRRASPQWFEAPFLSPSDEHVLVDGGAYDGDTIAAFIAVNGPAFRSIHAFEPDPALARRCAALHAGDQRIRVVAAGLAEVEGTAQFAGTASTDGRFIASAAGGEASFEVPLTTLDAAVHDTPTFVKLDVEGCEASALEGAARHLRTGRPTLAIAVYHRAADLWQLAELVDRLAPGRPFFLRHYTDTAFETVLYALP